MSNLPKPCHYCWQSKDRNYHNFYGSTKPQVRGGYSTEAWFLVLAQKSSLAVIICGRTLTGCIVYVKGRSCRAQIVVVHRSCMLCKCADRKFVFNKIARTIKLVN